MQVSKSILGESMAMEDREEGQPVEMRSRLAFEPHTSILVQPMKGRLQQLLQRAPMQLAVTGGKMNEQIP